MDLRHNQLPWSEQIWAKINADLAQALAQSRRVRAPFEVFHVPSSTQSVMADRNDPFVGMEYSDTETTPIIELSVLFALSQSQVHNEGDNFYALDRIIAAAYDIGVAEDELIINANLNASAKPNPSVVVSGARTLWDGIYYTNKVYPTDPFPVAQRFNNKLPSNNGIPVGLELYNAVVEARKNLREMNRYEPFALILSNDLEGEIQSTVRGTNSLNTPIERLKPLATAGIYTTPVLPLKTALLVSVARSWIDIAQAMEPSVQFLNIDAKGNYQMRLVERFAFRLKDRSARCLIKMIKV